MATITYEQLKAYAEKHFPENFATLQAFNFPTEETNNGIVMQIGASYEARIVIRSVGYISFTSSEIQSHVPFCWIPDANRRGERDQKINSLIRFYFMNNGFEAYLKSYRGDFFADLQSACADIANALQAKEAAIDDPSKWGITEAGQSQVQRASTSLAHTTVADVVQLQNRIQQLATTVDGLKSTFAIEYNAVKQNTDIFEVKMKNLEQQFANFKAEAQTAKAEAGKDGVDWAELFAASKIEVEKLKKNLTKAVTEKVVLEKQVAELRKKISE